MGGQHGINCSSIIPTYDLMEYNDLIDTTADGVFGLHTTGNTITPVKGFYLARASLKIYRVGSAIPCILSVYNVDIDHKPIGEPLITVTRLTGDVPTPPPYKFFNFDFVRPAFLSKNIEYALILSAPTGDAGHKIYWREDQVGTNYPRGGTLFSTDGGITWLYAEFGDYTFRTYK